MGVPIYQDIQSGSVGQLQSLCHDPQQTLLDKLTGQQITVSSKHAKLSNFGYYTFASQFLRLFRNYLALTTARETENSP
jgi:hypothetical protein